MDEEEFQALMRYQTMLSRQVVQEAKTDRKIKLLGVINQLTHSGKRKVQTAAILHEAEHSGMLSDDIYNIIDELLEDGVVVEAGQGFIKKA